MNDQDELEVAVNRGVSKSLEPFGWGALGMFAIFVGMSVASTVDDTLGGVLIVPSLVIVLFGIYLITYSIYELV